MRPYTFSIIIGDTISFDFFGSKKTGEVISISKHGYWILDTWSGWLRCPFNKANKVANKEISK